MYYTHIHICLYNVHARVCARLKCGYFKMWLSGKAAQKRILKQRAKSEKVGKQYANKRGAKKRGQKRQKGKNQNKQPQKANLLIFSTIYFHLL